MNKRTLLTLLLLTLLLTACSGNASNAAGPASGAPNGSAAGELSAPMQVAIGTIKLDGTDNAITAEQARELLPLWQTLEVLYGSDTAATQEIDALVQQIQDTMTAGQMQAITGLNLTRQDMMSIMQEQGMAMGGAQNANAQNGNSTTGRGDNFGGGGFQGPPPDGGFPGGAPNFQGQGSRSQSSSSTDSTTTRPAAIDPNRIPTSLVNAVIEYLKKKSGS